MHEHPRTAIPVKLNDVYFSFHAVFMTSIITYQCIVYEKKDQDLSKFSISALALIIFGFVSLCYSALIERITWLSLIYFCSIVKVFITPIKYFPQVKRYWYRDIYTVYLSTEYLYKIYIINEKYILLPFV